VQVSKFGAVTDNAPLVPRDAATVMLVRDGERGMEVCMLRRNLNSDFVGGAYVFPGGAVDPHDSSAEVEAICLNRDDKDASRQLGIDHGGLAFWVAAVRECFEESGVLLAVDSDGEVVSMADDATAERFAQWRHKVNNDGTSLVEVCAAENLRLMMGDIYYFAHWITPVGPTRRYDTRFFVAAAPPGQIPAHDDRETIATVWINPADALEQQKAGKFDLIFPTIKNLEAISRFDKAADLLAAAAAIDEVVTVLPRVVNDDHGLRILLPGDEGYDAVIESAASAEPIDPRDLKQ
jgi:8-oxo-dGTP pyrophosphatase MutT (NUDIX family)